LVAVVAALSCEVAKGGAEDKPKEKRDSAEPIVGPEWKPVEESTVLPSGIKVRSSYHFNRNALSAACLTDGAALALTDSGNLLRFDLRTLRLLRERQMDVALVALAYAPGTGCFAGAVDGRVFKIDPKMLVLTETAKLPAAPQWMSAYYDARKKKKGILAAVVRPLKGGGGVELVLHRLGLGPAAATTHKVPPPLVGAGRITAFYLDSKDRLWLGRDIGEWGGWCGALDLNTGKLELPGEFKGKTSSGVYGFIHLPDGQVWAYGGTMHLELSSGFIDRVDGGKIESLGSFGERDRADDDAIPKKPRYPIMHIVADPKGDGLLVFSYRDLFHVDTGLKKWRHLGRVELRYRWGRPDAMGSYPALRTVHPVGGGSAALICSTARDGLLGIADGKATSYVVPGQLGDDVIHSILPASGESVLDGSRPWRYASDRWQPVSVYPRLEPEGNERWYEYRLMLDKDRNLMALCRSNSFPGAAALTRWKGGKVETLARQGGEEGVSFSADRAFATPDGGFWCADRKELCRLVDGKWKQVGKAPDAFLWGIRVVGKGGPPWLLHAEAGLYRLDPGKGEGNATLKPVPLPAKVGKVYDALPLAPGKLLLATDAGLRAFVEDGGKLTDAPFTPPKAKVVALCRDGRGRLWLAGGGVWLVDAEGKVHSLDKVRLVGDSVRAIGADSAHDDGVIVALGKRGVLFLRAGDDRGGP
jgi:hypothetical protein